MKEITSSVSDLQPAGSRTPVTKNSKGRSEEQPLSRQHAADGCDCIVRNSLEFFQSILGLEKSGRLSYWRIRPIDIYIKRANNRSLY